MNRRLSRAICALAFILLVSFVYAFTFDAVTGPDIPGSDTANPGVKFVISPYVQKMTTDGVTIMWQTNVPSKGELSVSGGDLKRSYQASESRRLHEIRVGKLSPDTWYSYSIKTGGTEKIGRFRTFPEKQRTMRFIVYGDTRTHPERHKKVIEAIAKEGVIDFVLVTGDLVADGRKLETWPLEFFTPAAAMMRGTPFYTVLGNHEKNSDYYFQYFSLPGIERYYSFQVGDIYIAGLDSNIEFDETSKQYGWLVTDLKAATDAKWKFVFMHHPTYTSGSHGNVDSYGVPEERGIRTAQQVLPKLATKHGINAVFSGHDHAYEKSERDGVRYIVTGGGGAPNYGNPNAKHNKYSRVFKSVLHYCVIDIDGDKAIMTVKMPDGKVIDRIEY